MSSLTVVCLDLGGKGNRAPKNPSPVPLCMLDYFFAFASYTWYRVDFALCFGTLLVCCGWSIFRSRHSHDGGHCHAWFGYGQLLLPICTHWYYLERTIGVFALWHLPTCPTYLPACLFLREMGVAYILYIVWAWPEWSCTDIWGSTYIATPEEWDSFKRTNPIWVRGQAKRNF